MAGTVLFCNITMQTSDRDKTRRNVGLLTILLSSARQRCYTPNAYTMGGARCGLSSEKRARQTRALPPCSDVLLQTSDGPPSCLPQWCCQTSRRMRKPSPGYHLKSRWNKADLPIFHEIVCVCTNQDPMLRVAAISFNSHNMTPIPLTKIKLYDDSEPNNYRFFLRLAWVKDSNITCK